MTGQIMKPRLTVIDGKVTTTSLIVAEHFGKQHKDVLRAVANLECSPGFIERNFALNDYLDPIGRRLPMYRITKNGFAFLVMGFTGKKAAAWKERYIEAFDAMEQMLRAKVPAHLNSVQALPNPVVTSAVDLMRIYCAMDRSIGSATLLRLLIELEAHERWCRISMRQIIDLLDHQLSIAAVAKGMRRLENSGLIAIRDDGKAHEYFVHEQAVQAKLGHLLLLLKDSDPSNALALANGEGTWKH